VANFVNALITGKKNHDLAVEKESVASAEHGTIRELFAPQETISRDVREEQTRPHRFSTEITEKNTLILDI